MAACSAAAADDAAGYNDDSVSAPRARCFSVGAIAISEERNEMRTRASDFLLDYLYGGSSSAAAAAQRSDDGNDDGDREEQRGIERSSAQPRKVFDVAPSLLLPPETTVRRSRSGRSGRSRGPRDGRTDGRTAGQCIHHLIRHCRDRVDFSRGNVTGGHVWLEGGATRNLTGRFGIDAGEKKNGFFASFITHRRLKFFPTFV